MRLRVAVGITWAVAIGLVILNLYEIQKTCQEEKSRDANSLPSEPLARNVPCPPCTTNSSVTDPPHLERKDEELVIPAQEVDEEDDGEGEKEPEEAVGEIEEDPFKVPNIVHYVWYATTAKNFEFHQMLSVFSASKMIEPESIYFHTNMQPYGEYWERVLKIPNFTIVHRNPPIELFGEKIKDPVFYTSHSNVDRLKILTEYGGIYLDLDVLVTKSFDELRKHDCTVGLELPDQVCNSVVVCAKSSPFLMLWLNSFLDDYQVEEWSYNSGKVPYRLSRRYSDLVHVENDTINRPNFKELHKIWGPSQYDWENNYVIHLYFRVWKTMSPFYKGVDPDDKNIMTNDNTFSRIARMILHSDGGFFGEEENATPSDTRDDAEEDESDTVDDEGDAVEDYSDDEENGDAGNENSDADSDNVPQPDDDDEEDDDYKGENEDDSDVTIDSDPRANNKMTEKVTMPNEEGEEEEDEEIIESNNVERSDREREALLKDIQLEHQKKLLAEKEAKLQQLTKEVMEAKVQQRKRLEGVAIIEPPRVNENIHVDDNLNNGRNEGRLSPPQEIPVKLPLIQAPVMDPQLQKVLASQDENVLRNPIRQIIESVTRESPPVLQNDHYVRAQQTVRDSQQIISPDETFHTIQANEQQNIIANNLALRNSMQNIHALDSPQPGNNFKLWPKGPPSLNHAITIAPLRKENEESPNLANQAVVNQGYQEEVQKSNHVPLSPDNNPFRVASRALLPKRVYVQPGMPTPSPVDDVIPERAWELDKGPQFQRIVGHIDAQKNREEHILNKIYKDSKGINGFTGFGPFQPLQPRVDEKPTEKVKLKPIEDEDNEPKVADIDKEEEFPADEDAFEDDDAIIAEEDMEEQIKKEAIGGLDLGEDG